MRRLIAVCLAIVIMGFGFSVAQAASVEPESATLNVALGDKVHQTVRFENDSQSEQTYELKLMKVSFGTSADDLQFTELEPVESSWIKLDRQTFTLEPGNDQAIEVTVTAPEAAPAQVFSFALVAVAQAQAGSGIEVANGSASIFFVNVGEGLTSNLKIDSFATVPERVHHVPVRFAALVTNAGPGLAEPEMAVAVRNMWGKQVALVPMNPTGRRLPGYTDRVFSAVWTASNWRFGVYTAQLYVFPDTSATALTASLSVVLFAWQPLAVFIVLAIFLATGTYLFLRARRH